MPNRSTIKLPVTKVYTSLSTAMADDLAVEEPLEIRVEYGSADDRQTKSISVTMRTPGHDPELATGFLFTEGVVKQLSDIEQINQSKACAENKENVVTVSLAHGIEPELKNTERNFYTTSSCGVCGKGSISAIRTVTMYGNVNNHAVVTPEVIHSLPDVLTRHQEIFSITGGLHACALFNLSGDLVMVREDIGRHNALDKLIGAALENHLLPLADYILLLSGRASFELIQKAAMAGIKIIAAVSAPSSLAVELAKEFDITLMGFLRSHRFNIYTSPNRVDLPASKVANPHNRQTS